MFLFGCLFIAVAQQRFEYGVVRHCDSIVEVVVVFGLFVNMKFFNGVHHGSFFDSMDYGHTIFHWV